MEKKSILYRKWACITGATGGLGQSLCHVFAKEGCKLVITARHEERLKILADELENQYDADVEICVADLGTDDGIENVLKAMEIVGGIDILINNAGVFHVKSIRETTKEDFDQCFALNVRAPFLLAKTLVDKSLAHGHGWARIVNIGSSSAFGAAPNTSIYCGSKHALLGLSRAFFAELRSTNIRTYSVNPGSIQTEMGKQVPGQDFNTFLDPNDIANFIVNMLRNESNMISEEVRLNRFVMK